MATISIENAHKIVPAMKRAIAGSLNKTVRKGRVATSKEIRKTYNIKARDLLSRTKTFRANKNKLRAGFFVTSKSKMKMLFFGARENNKGVSVLIKKTSGRKTIKSAFVAKMPSGHVNVFRRTGRYSVMKKGGYVGQKREEIESLESVGIVKMHEKVGEKIIERIFNDEYNSTFEHEVDYQLSRL